MGGRASEGYTDGGFSVGVVPQSRLELWLGPNPTSGSILGFLCLNRLGSEFQSLCLGPVTPGSRGLDLHGGVISVPKE